MEGCKSFRVRRLTSHSCIWVLPNVGNHEPIVWVDLTPKRCVYESNDIVITGSIYQYYPLFLIPLKKRKAPHFVILQTAIMIVSFMRRWFCSIFWTWKELMLRLMSKRRVWRLTIFSLVSMRGRNVIAMDARRGKTRFRWTKETITQEPSEGGTVVISSKIPRCFLICHSHGVWGSR